MIEYYRENLKPFRGISWLGRGSLKRDLMFREACKSDQPEKMQQNFILLFMKATILIESYVALVWLPDF